MQAAGLPFFWGGGVISENADMCVFNVSNDKFVHLAIHTIAGMTGARGVFEGILLFASHGSQSQSDAAAARPPHSRLDDFFYITKIEPLLDNKGKFVGGGGRRVYGKTVCPAKGGPIPRLSFCCLFVLADEKQDSSRQPHFRRERPKGAMRSAWARRCTQFGGHMYVWTETGSSSWGCVAERVDEKQSRGAQRTKESVGTVRNEKESSCRLRD
jgi:hypothetical protein